LFKRTDLDYYTMWLYMQKAEDWELKDKILDKLNNLLLEMWEAQPMAMNNEMANSAANIMMSQWQPSKEELITRDKVNLDPNMM
jgi:hypothetical protein